MILLDAYALTALLAGGASCERGGPVDLARADSLAAPNLAEAADRLDRIHTVAVARTRSAVESLEQSIDLNVRVAERVHAWHAAGLRSKHYHRTRRPLSLADCMLLAMTGEEDRLATADPHVLDTAADERLGWIALADSHGRRHAPAPHPE